MNLSKELETADTRFVVDTHTSTSFKLGKFAEFNSGVFIGNMEAQYNIGFEREPEMTREDMRNMADRRAGMTLTKHEPKR